MESARELNLVGAVALVSNRIFKVAMKAWQLLSSKKKWTKGVMAAGPRGGKREIKDPEAICWCAAGAIFKCYEHPDINRVLIKLERELKIYGHLSITIWNDAPSRKFSEVRALLKKLDI